jgi:zinc transporter
MSTGDSAASVETETSEPSGLISAYLFNEQGEGREIGWEGIRSWEPERGFLCVHLDRTHEEARAWLTGEAGLDAIVGEALLAEETRPRALSMGDALLVLLRGVNLNPGADPEDMVSIRLWIDPQRAIRLRAKKLLAVQDIRDRVAAGAGPRTAGEFLPALAARLVDRMGPVLDGLDDDIAALEERLIEEQASEIRGQLGLLRRRAIALRRYLAPQRDVLARLSLEQIDWLSDRDRASLREVADRVTRYVEDLDAARERAAVTQEELAARLSEQMNTTMYVLSIVAALFLPLLGFLTGLLGINVAGIPGTGNPLAFTIVCGIIVGVVAVQLWLFRKRHWL